MSGAGALNFDDDPDIIKDTIATLAREECPWCGDYLDEFEKCTRRCEASRRIYRTDKRQ